MRILIVDDDARLRERAKELLAAEPDISVIGEATDGREAIDKARTLKPELILMDIKMPAMNGLEATRQLTAEMPALNVIMLTLFDLPEYQEAALASGASGYVIKKEMLETLLPLIRRESLVGSGKVLTDGIIEP